MSSEIHPLVQAWLDEPENYGCEFMPERVLDDKGRCCGRKPFAYKRDRNRFCGCCDASFDLVTGKQKENWAYWKTIGGWIKARHSCCFHTRPPRERDGIAFHTDGNPPGPPGSFGVLNG